MLKYLFLLVITVTAFEFVCSQDTLKTTVYFGVDKDVASSKELLKLDPLLSQKESPFKILLYGHTDSDGSDGYNQDLAKRRVNNVKDYLVSKYKGAISTDYYGEKQPIASNSTEEQKWKNRRVEALFIFEEDTSDYITMEDVYKELSVPVQEFYLETDHDTSLVLSEGTVLNIKANTFHTPNDKMKLKVKEVYSYPEMIGERVTTHSNFEQLETGGMISIEATTTNGQEISAQKDLAVFMPTNEIKDDMQVFYGEHDTAHQLNWQLGDSIDERMRVSSTIIGMSNQMLIMGQIPYLEGGCPFFWCGVRKGLSNMLGAINENWMFETREALFSRKYQDSLQQLMDSLGVSNYQELQQKLIENRVESGAGTSREVGYYAFSTSQLGWINCDRFTGRKPLVAMKTNVDVNEDNFTSLVFIEMKSIFPGRSNGSTLSFYNVPSGDPVYHVIIKTRKDKVLLSKVRTKVTNNAPRPEFEEIELSELRTRLASLVD